MKYLIILLFVSVIGCKSKNQEVITFSKSDIMLIYANGYLEGFINCQGQNPGSGVNHSKWLEDSTRMATLLFEPEQ